MSRTLLPLLLIAGMLPAISARSDENGGELRWPTETDVEIDVELVSGSIEFEGWDLDEVMAGEPLLVLNHTRNATWDMQGYNPCQRVRSVGGSGYRPRGRISGRGPRRSRRHSTSRDSRCARLGATRDRRGRC